MRNTIPVALGSLATATALSLAVSGCSATPVGAATNPATTTVTIFAAASLRATFEQLEKRFEASHPGVTVHFNFAGSQALATQLVEGAAADVFASANQDQMAIVTDAGLNAAEPRVFATNRLTIAVPPGNPAGITHFRDLAAKGLKVVVCAPVVPCGAATHVVEKATGIALSPVSQEQAVTDVLAKVQAGEADAGLVYRTDVLSAHGSVDGVEFPEAAKAINANPIVLLKGAPSPALGQDWINLVFSASGRKVLADAGFGAAG